MSYSILVSVTVLVIVRAFLKYRSKLKDRPLLDTLTCTFEPLSFPAALSPTFWNSLGMWWTWKYRLSGYQRIGGETFKAVPLLWGNTVVYTSDPHVSKQVVSVKSSFFKHPRMFIGLTLWGNNIVSANGDDWKRYRKVVGPVFSNATYRMVWSETLRLYYEMIRAEDWAQHSVSKVANVNDFTSKLALLVICSCGFGLESTWVEKKRSPDGQMSFSEALALVSGSIIPRLVTPRWAYMLPIKYLRDIEASYVQLAAFMQSYIETKKSELQNADADTPPSRDLLTRLVESEDAEDGLNRQEIIANVFVFMFAGHETTARTLAACLALLAVYPDEQDAVVKQINAVLTDRRDPTMDDIPSLPLVSACFCETARLFPAALFLLRDAQEDNVLTSLDGKEFVIPAGTRVAVDLVGMHYNPRLYPEPNEFKPARWIGVPEVDLTFFGMGPRSCLGRKFALAEAVCFLTLFLRDWIVDLDLSAGESRAEWRERVMQAQSLGLGHGVEVIPLTFRKRNP